MRVGRIRGGVRDVAIVFSFEISEINIKHQNMKTSKSSSRTKIKSNLTKFVTVDSLQTKKALFDVVLSFSSIEHDGLGRYCDPINPDGDRAAMEEPDVK